MSILDEIANAFLTILGANKPIQGSATGQTWYEKSNGQYIAHNADGTTAQINPNQIPAEANFYDYDAKNVQEQVVQPVQTINDYKPAPMVQQTMGARNPAFSRYNVSAPVRTAIENAANEFNIPSSLLYDIALQESSFNPTLRNQQAGSTAEGLFQFTNGTWDTVNRYARMPGSSLRNWNNPNKLDVNSNARAAAYLIKNGQLGRWNASQGVWGPQYSKEEVQPFYSQTTSNEIPNTNWKTEM